MGQLRAGALETYLRPVDLDEILATVVEDLGPGGPDIALRIPEDLSDVIADADLLTRVLTSLTAEALHGQRGRRPDGDHHAARGGRPEPAGRRPAGQRRAKDLLSAWRERYSTVKVVPDVVRGHPARVLASLSARADLTRHRQAHRPKPRIHPERRAQPRARPDRHRRVTVETRCVAASRQRAPVPAMR